jgi:hypothetical protein
MDMSAAFSYAEAERSDMRVRGTSDHAWSPFTILPRRLELRLSPADFMDFGVDLGWIDVGADLRVGIAADEKRPWVGHVALGARSGAVLLGTKELPSEWVRLEAYPLVNGPRGRLVLALGAHHGYFYHQLNYDPPEHDTGDGLVNWAISVIRRELRIETAFGYVHSFSAGSLLIALEPYVVPYSEQPRVRCEDCEAVRWEQHFGAVIVFRQAFFRSFK